MGEKPIGHLVRGYCLRMLAGNLELVLTAFSILLIPLNFTCETGAL